MSDERTVKVKRVKLLKFMETKPLGEEGSTQRNLAEIHAISQNMIDTDAIPTIKTDPISDGVIARTNAYIKHTPGAVILLRRKETDWEEARVIELRPSPQVGWLIVDCFTRKARVTLEVTANFPFMLKLQYP